MQTKRLSLISILFWTILVLACFLNENVALAFSNFREGFDLASFLILSLLVLFLLVLYFIIEHKHCKLKWHKVFLPILTLCFIIGTISIWLEPEAVTFSNINEITVTLSVQDKVTAMVEGGISLLIIYIMLYPRKQLMVRNSLIKWIAYAFSLVMIIYFILSFIVEKEGYYNLFHFEDAFPGFIGGKVMVNSNIYAAGFFVAILMLMVIDNLKPHWYHHVLMLTFYIAGLFSGCSSTFIILSVVLPTYFIYRIVMWYVVKKWKRATVYLSIFVILGIVAGGTIGGGFACGNGTVLKLIRAFQEMFPSGSFFSFHSRTQIWTEAWRMLNESPTYLIWGRGHGLSKLLIKGYSRSIQPYGVNSYPFSSCHDTFMEVLFRYGIFGAIIYYAAMGYFIYCCLYLFFKKKRKSYAAIYLLAFFAVIAHGVVESDLFMNVEVKDLMMSMVIFYPPIYTYYHERHHEAVEEMKKEPAPVVTFDGKKIRQCLVLFATGIYLSGITLLFAKEATAYRYTSQIAIAITIAYLSFLLFIPLIVTNIPNVKSRKRLILRILLASLFTLLCIGGATLLGLLCAPNRHNAGYIVAATVFVTFALLFTYFVLIKKKEGKKEEILTYFKKEIREVTIQNWPALAIPFAFGAVFSLSLSQMAGFCGLHYLLLFISDAVCFFFVLFIRPKGAPIYFLDTMKGMQIRQIKTKIEREVY